MGRAGWRKANVYLVVHRLRFLTGPNWAFGGLIGDGATPRGAFPLPQRTIWGYQQCQQADCPEGTNPLPADLGVPDWDPEP